MRELPRGTVTFLFTDIEGSTRLLQELGGGYPATLAEHRRVLREAFAQHRGVEVDTQGDAFFVAFARVADALAAAEEGQRALQTGPIRVRMGIHTGEPVPTEEGYVGIDVHRAARICAVAHGGQIVLSESTKALLDGNFQLEDLGLHRLKDLAEPAKLFQLGGGEFPPLRSLNATNLPTQPTPLVGRDRELAEVLRLLGSTRLVTLTGAGGSGKTRLALQAAAELVNEFRDGVFWVSLAALTDPELALPTITATVGAKDDLAQFVDEKRLLLLLDNLEQILGCAPALAELLGACPNLKLLVTSRAPLRIGGEQEYEVPPLPEAEAVELFTQRARQVKAGFEPDKLVGEICRRLDGLPLALELAAARVKLLSPQQILERLGHSLDLLTTGARDLPERQRTLRATIEWSYQLLDEDEMHLFGRLAAFAGSFDLEAAAEVTEAGIDSLASLVDKSLLRQTGEGRFFMLGTIREYGLERLHLSAEFDSIGSHHTRYYLSLAQDVSAELRGPRQAEVLLALATEEDNFRVALERAITAHDAQLALQLCVALGEFWYDTDRILEGRGWFERAVSLPGDVPPKLRASALRAYASLEQYANAYEQAASHLRESAAIFQEHGDLAEIAASLRSLGLALGDASNLHERITLLEEALQIYDRLGDDGGRRRTLHLLGECARDAGNYERARECLRESIELSRAAGDEFFVGASTHSLGDLALDERDLERAERLYRAALRISTSLAVKRQVAPCLAGLAAVAALRGYGDRAAIIWDTVQSIEDELGIRLLSTERRRYEQALGDLALSTSPAAGLSYERAVDYALADVD